MLIDKSTQDGVYIHGTVLDSSAFDTVDDLQQLNGDYAIVVKREGKIHLVTDAFKTKNLFFNSEHFVFGTKPSDFIKRNIAYYPVKPNTIMTYDKGWTIETAVHFNFEQKTNHLDKVFEQLEKAVLQRYNSETVVSLTSGYDSGVIACALHKNGHKEFTVSNKGEEDIKVLAERIGLHKGKIVDLGKMPDLDYKYDVTEYQMIHTGILSHMIQNNKTTVLNGYGGDEVYQDDGFNGVQNFCKSKFGGFFPKDLELVWPWHESYEKLSSRVTRLDAIAQTYDCVSKFPLLDLHLVQAWLNTTQELKNARYKNWMYQYMRLNDYPILENIKIGFPEING